MENVTSSCGLWLSPGNSLFQVSSKYNRPHVDISSRSLHPRPSGWGWGGVVEVMPAPIRLVAGCGPRRELELYMYGLHSLKRGFPCIKGTFTIRRCALVQGPFQQEGFCRGALISSVIIHGFEAEKITQKAKLWTDISDSLTWWQSSSPIHLLAAGLLWWWGALMGLVSLDVYGDVNSHVNRTC